MVSEVLDKAKFMKEIDIGNPINSNLVRLSWKYIVLGYFDWKRFTDALNMVLTLHTSYLNNNEDSFTSTCVKIVVIVRSKVSVQFSEIGGFQKVRNIQVRSIES